MTDATLPIGEPVEYVEMSPPHRKVYEGQFVEMRPVAPEADIGELYACSHLTEENERLWTYLYNGPFASQEDMLVWVRQCASTDDPLFFTVFDKASGKRVGMLSYMRIKPKDRSLELGSIWYTPAVQRTKINTECIYLLLKESFDALNYRRVEWKCNALNEPSRKAAHRLGFSFEGVFVKNMIVKGRNRDTAWFAMLDDEWPAIKANMERWLYADEEGLSLSKLNESVKRH